MGLEMETTGYFRTVDGAKIPIEDKFARSTINTIQNEVENFEDITIEMNDDGYVVAKGKVVHTSTYTDAQIDDKTQVVQSLTSGTKIGSVGGTDLFAPSGGGVVVDSLISVASTNPVQNKVIYAELQKKQDVISDLATIRSDASKAAVAYQKPSTGIPASDIADGVIPKVVQTLSAGTEIGSVGGTILYAPAAGNVSIDSSLSETSTNPVQNKVINGALNSKQDTLTDIDMQAIADMHRDPTSLKNPYAITFKKGDTSTTYDGSSEVTIEIPVSAATSTDDDSSTETVIERQTYTLHDSDGTVIKVSGYIESSDNTNFKFLPGNAITFTFTTTSTYPSAKIVYATAATSTVWGTAWANESTNAGTYTTLFTPTSSYSPNGYIQASTGSTSAEVNGVKYGINLIGTLSGSTSSSSSSSSSSPSSSSSASITAGSVSGNRRFYNNIFDMMADGDVSGGDICVLSGFYKAGDGGGAEFYMADASNFTVGTNGSIGPVRVSGMKGFMSNYFRSPSITIGSLSTDYINNSSPIKYCTNPEETTSANVVWADFKFTNNAGATIYPYLIGNQDGYINVKQWGAVGNGVADDTLSIQSAIDDGNRQNLTNVFLPIGCYKVTEPLILPGNSTIRGVYNVGANYVPSSFNGQFDEGASQLLFMPTKAYTPAGASSAWGFTPCLILDGREGTGFTTDPNNTGSPKSVFQGVCERLTLWDLSGRKDTVGIEVRNIQNDGVVEKIRACGFGYAGIVVDNVRYTNGVPAISHSINLMDSPAICHFRDIWLNRNKKYHMYFDAIYSPLTVENLGCDINNNTTVYDSTQALMDAIYVDNAAAKTTISFIGMKIEVGTQSGGTRTSSQYAINGVHFGSNFNGVANFVGCWISGWANVNNYKWTGGSGINIESANAQINMMGTVIGNFDYAYTKNGTHTNIDSSYYNRYAFQTI